MKEIKIIICDDSRIAADTIAGAVRSVFEEKQISIAIKQFTDARELMTFCKTNFADLALLDIEMPGINGIELGKIIRENKAISEIIYISNREDQVFSALQVHPFGFIRKSHFLKDAEDILGSWADLCKKKQEKNQLLVVTEDGYRKIDITEIIYFEGSGAYQQMFLSGKDEPVRITSRMKILEEQLSELGFLRIHKGFMVNCSYISSIKTGAVVMKNGVSLPISRGKTQEIKSSYLTYCRENGVMLF